MLHGCLLRFSCTSRAAMPCHVCLFAFAQAEASVVGLHVACARCTLYVACCPKQCCTLNVARCTFRIAWSKSQAEAPVIGFIRTALLPLVKDKLELRSEAEASVADGEQC